MANEFVARNGIISLDSSQITGSLNVSSGITGSLFGTSSFAINALTASFLSGSVTSASYALTASSATFAASALTASSVTNLNQNVIISGSTRITGSLGVTGSFSISGSLGTLLTANVDTLILTGSLVTLGSIQLTGSMNVLGGVTSSLFGTASQAISASYAATASLALAVTGGFSKSFAIVNNSNISATDVGTFPVWRCSTPCTASMILGYTDSGSAVLVNARKNTSNLLASDLSITTDTWVSSSTLQNQNFNLGDILSFTLVSFSSTPKEITIQANFNY